MSDLEFWFISLISYPLINWPVEYSS